MTDWDYERKMAEMSSERTDEEMETLHKMMDSIDHMPDHVSTNTLVFYVIAILTSYGIEGEEAERLLVHAAQVAPQVYAIDQSNDAINRLMANSKH